MSMEKHLYIIVLCALLPLHILLVQGARQDIKCGGVTEGLTHVRNAKTVLSHLARLPEDNYTSCRALVDEMEWAISQIDPKKIIQTGSFRINPDGSQSVREVPFARSEGHLLELMEEVCEKMKDYGERVDPTTNRKTYVRHTSRDGTAMDLSDVAFDSRVNSSLKFACETIVEQHEDEIIEFFAHETDNVKDKLCSKRTDLCDHALKIPHDEL
ncbi:protein canopy homolog 2 isoform X2 [Myxocyprinus asiaticus]|uniref:protein canopy homolog 2 isoform X2 n=1 Tax=Myxocyprinus asiaticus TaxID=70543 RepID=UPI0022215F18|nr:protein canopy homolog 2 isoform X2 [Myxocyprinus asiaticus]